MQLSSTSWGFWNGLSVCQTKHDAYVRILLYSRRAGENMMRTAIISEKKKPVQNITKQHTTSHSCFLSYQARIHFFPYADILDTGTEACAHLSIFAAASALVTCQTHGLVHSLPLFFSFSRGNRLLQHFNKTDTGGLQMAVACFKMIDPIDA